MHKQLIFLGMLLVLCLAPALQATSIIFVSDRYDEKPDGTPDDAGLVDFLRSQGYTVDYRAGPANGNGYWRTLDAAKIAELNAADLIIVSRNLGSGEYDDAPEPTQWNGIVKPLLDTTPYVSRSSHWAWFNVTTLREDSGTPTLVAVDPHHPIFKGVNLNAKNQVDIYDQSVGSGTVSLYGALAVGNGTLLGKALTGDWSMIAEFQPGKPFYAGGPQTPAAKRMFFACGTREGGGQGRGEFNLNAEGKTLFLNAVEYMLGNLVREPWVKAWQPDPADRTVNVSLPLLKWTKGDTAAWHNVYVGTTPNLTEANLVASRLTNAVHFATNLPAGTKCYWRVDEVEVNGTVHTGDVWSFTTASLLAFSPEPQDGAKWIEPALVTLKWQGGQGAYKHDVYFGTDKTAVTEGTGDTFQVTQLPTVFDAGELAEGVTYFWRVDEVLLDGTKRTGSVWSFTTLAPGGGIRGLYFSNASLMGLPVINQIDPQINFNWADASPTGLPADGFSVRWVGELEVPFSETYTFYPTTDDGVRLWVNDVKVLDLWANRRSATEAKGSIDLVGGQRYPITMEFYNAEGTAVAELRWESPSIPKDLIPQGAYSPAVRASSPIPPSGAVDVPQTAVLMWNAGEKATQHDVYFGADANAVAAADTASSLYKGRQAADQTSFDPGVLDWNKRYSWRIDEVNDTDAASPWQGSVWSFTTADFIVVDDFESYNDEEGQDTRLYETWIDGYTDNLSGSVVGNMDPPFAEQTIVHGGRQSMPMDYNNINPHYFSEVYREFSPVQNWAVNGVNDLVVWFRGHPLAYQETAPGAFTMSASGTDIWNTADEFRFAFKRLSGNGSIMAKVESVGNTDGWAKGGVMIRQSLEAGAPFAYMVATPGQGVSFGWRQFADGTCDSDGQAGIQTPQWVKLTRTGDVFTAQYSADGKTWTDVKTDDGTATTATTITMSGTVYIGLCVTSHNANAVTTVQFSGVTATGGTGNWQMVAIGKHPGNSPQGLYLAVEDSAGKKATITYSDAAATNITAWTQWKISLSAFQGVNLTRVKALYIGVGDKASSVPDGTGRIYIDDIRVVKP